MDEAHKQLVRDSWGELLERRERVGELFYARLFEMAPALRELFRGDIRLQAEQLTRMLDRAVASLDDPDSLLPMMAELGRRHAGFGIKEDDFRTFGEALIWSLQRALWSDFTPETEAAWCELYQLLSKSMMSGARTDQRPLNEVS